MAGEITVLDLPCIIAGGAGVDAGYGVSYTPSPGVEDEVSLPALAEDPAFAGVLVTGNKRLYPVGTVAGSKVTRRVMGNALVKVTGSVTKSAYGAVQTDGTFSAIVPADPAVGHWASVRFLRDGANGSLIPAEVLNPPQYIVI